MLRCISLLLLIVFAGALLADDLTTTDGDVLVGKFEKLEGGEVYFTTDSVGLLKVPVAKVAALNLDAPREVRVRTGDNVKDQQQATLRTVDGDVVIELEAGDLEVESLAGIKGIDETLPDERPKWDVSALGTFAWSEGNTRTYTLGMRFDIKRETKRNWMTLFGRGSYFQDRNLEEDPVRERKYHFGYYYRYIFDFNLTIDLTEDLYFNEFAGYHYRSVTGLGPGYYIFRRDDLSWHVGAHLTYTYEDQMNGAEDRGYIGARITTEFDWKSPSGSLHVNYKGALMFDFDETKNLTGQQSLLIEHKFLSYFTAGLLIEHDWDNLPPPKFKHHDFRFTATLGFSWSGRGF
ncbi:MAG: DUF481 domain-containing protein [Planctomycetes bacterium]|nr:DUF481 domain-containing protein [Planctomycetota bacterium]